MIYAYVWERNVFCFGWIPGHVIKCNVSVLDEFRALSQCAYAGATDRVAHRNRTAAGVPEKFEEFENTKKYEVHQWSV